MNITVDNMIALGLVALAWVGRIVGPSPAANIAGWIIGIIATLLVLIGAIG
jgi:hypothetical protein